MDRMLMSAEVRPSLSKGQLNRMRQEDKVPAVVYGRGKDTQALVVDGKQLRQVLAAGGSNVLIELQIKGKGDKIRQETVMFKDIERHLIQKDKVMHVDFIRISMTDQIEVAVQLTFTGEPEGVKQGGILQVILREVAVKCLPTDIPETIEVDLSNLNIGESITAGSLSLPPDVELITAPEELLAQVLAPEMEEEPAAEAGEEKVETAGGAEEAPSAEEA
ncbi:MAG: 50S ribosomal protein L25 [Firmicutes bacterium]|jgi:large subunit ribosomal protein L25|nr:50S ribosomal protein L25 [Bacillota bacterium]